MEIPLVYDLLPFHILGNLNVNSTFFFFLSVLRQVMLENSFSKKESDRYQLGREEGLWNVKIHQAPGTDYAVC